MICCVIGGQVGAMCDKILQQKQTIGKGTKAAGFNVLYFEGFHFFLSKAYGDKTRLGRFKMETGITFNQA